MDLKEELKKIKDFISKNIFLRSVFMLSSGNVIAQVINFVGMPFITRIYPPSVFGVYTLLSTNAALISGVANLGMMLSFLLPEDDDEARALSRFVLSATTCISGIAVTILFCYQEHYKIVNTSDISYSVFLVMVFFYIIATTVNGICYAYINRHKLYGVMFWNPIIYAFVNIVLFILLGHESPTSISYIIATIAATAISILQMCYCANPFSGYDKREYEFRKLLIDYKRFPLFQMPANFISGVGKQIPIQTIELVFSTTILGLWSMALKVMSLPISFLAAHINKIYFQEASQRFARGEEIGEFALNTLEVNIKLAIVPILMVAIFGDFIFSFALGDRWKEAGTLAGLIASYQLVEFANTCIGGSFVIIKKNTWNVISGIAFVGIGLFLWGICKNYPTISIGWFLIIMSTLFTLRAIIANVFLFYATGADMRRYIFFVLKYIMPVHVIVITVGIMKGSLKW